MTEGFPRLPREEMERERARLLQMVAEAQAQAAKVERELRDLAELERLAAAYNMHLTPITETRAERNDGRDTLAHLIHEYRNDALSPYKGLRFGTRRFYDTLLKRFDPHQEIRLEDLDEQYIRDELHNVWTDNGARNTPMGIALIGMLSRVLKFGAHTLKDERCVKALVILEGMNFRVQRLKGEVLTEKHVRDIIKMAHEMGRPSIALAQAFQFDLQLRQKDVIGEWIPEIDPEPGVPEFVYDGKKWLRGLRWDEVDPDSLILRHFTSHGSHLVQKDLHDCKLVMRELMARATREGKPPLRGPIIVCESTQRPWIANEFRRWWRKIADAAGVPKTVKNMDSRKKNGEPKDASE